MGELYTIGHSNYDIDVFIGLLKKYKVDYVIDVRTVPGCSYCTQYNKDKLRDYLDLRGIRYAYMGKYLGARQEDPRYYCKEGFVDFGKIRRASWYNAAIENIIKGLNQGHTIALMCVEQDPLDCHRGLMISKTFYEKGIDLKHIMPDGSLMDKRLFFDSLIKKYSEGIQAENYEELINKCLINGNIKFGFACPSRDVSKENLGSIYNSEV